MYFSSSSSERDFPEKRKLKQSKEMNWKTGNQNQEERKLLKWESGKWQCPEAANNKNRTEKMNAKKGGWFGILSQFLYNFPFISFIPSSNSNV